MSGRAERSKRGFRVWHGLLLAYLMLLGISSVQRWGMPTLVPALEPNQHIARVAEIRGDGPTSSTPRTIDLAYADYPATGGYAGIPVLLVHGSPGDGGSFHGLAGVMRGPRRLLAPDLPGFGQSTEEIADYSIRAHAAYLWELLDQLGIKKVHVVGFSMGGGVALHMADSRPSQVASITMLSAIGVQEMELLGDYHLNHAIHGVQLWGLEALRYGFPRFGSWNRTNMGIPYARNFYDSDQRPLRRILQRYAGPMLIIHGKKDPLVPVEAAYEHARLAPQSEMDIHEGDHFTVFVKPAELERPLRDFFAEVERGGAKTRATADSQRAAQAAMPMDTHHWPKPLPITAVVMFIGFALFTFASEDLACITAGLFVAEGRASFLFVTLACLAGIFVGDVLLYLAGRCIGRRALRRAPLRWFVSDRALKDSSAWLEKNGAAVIFTSRFVPGTRLPTYLAAGALHTSFARFTAYFLGAAAVWTPLLVAISAGLLTPLERLGMGGGRPLAIKLLLAVPLLYLAIRVICKLVTHRGRRELIGWWRRKLRWEFWPPLVFYPPVIVYIFYLAMKHGGLTVFAAANPGIVAGGFVGESKTEILRNLAGAGKWIPRFAPIGATDPETRVRDARQFMEQAHLQYPVVLKPDAGQRGSGVAVIRSEEQLREYLTATKYPAMLQEFVGGPEFGVFYVRYPGEERGRIFSVTEKVLPALKGDGKSTVEQMILADERAVCMADFYLRKNQQRLQTVPVKDERVELVDLGTHCRGAIFLDGEELITPELQTAIDGIAKSFDGFYFGRFDVRAASKEELRAGRNFKVIELNGVSSEATHIYDPKLTLRQAYAVLFAQWRMAFEIGAMNRAKGVSVPGAAELLRMAVAYRDTSQEHPG